MLKALHRPRAPRGSSLSSWPGLVTSWQLRGRTAKGRRGRGPSVLSGPWPWRTCRTWPVESPCPGARLGPAFHQLRDNSSVGLGLLIRETGE